MVLALTCAVAWAHPGPGIVVDKDGVIYVAGGPRGLIFRFTQPPVLDPRPKISVLNAHHLVLTDDGIELSAETQVQALAELQQIATKAQQHAKDHGYTEDDIDAAVDAAIADVRRRKRS